MTSAAAAAAFLQIANTEMLGWANDGLQVSGMLLHCLYVRGWAGLLLLCLCVRGGGGGGRPACLMAAAM